MSSQSFKCCPQCGAVLKISSTANGNLTCPKCSVKMHTRDLVDAPSVVVLCPKCSAKIRTYVQKADHLVTCCSCSYSASLREFGRVGGNHFNDLMEAANQHNDDASHTEINPNRKPQASSQLEDGATCINMNVAHGDSYTTRLIDGHHVPIYPRPLSIRFFKDEGETVWYGAKDLGAFKEGRQVVGRAGRGVDIECPTRDLYFSRAHFAVVVEYVSRLGSFRHYVTDNGCENAIRVQRRGESVWHLVAKGDMLIINDGDRVKVGRTILEIFYK